MAKCSTSWPLKVVSESSHVVDCEMLLSDFSVLSLLVVLMYEKHLF